MTDQQKNRRHDECEPRESAQVIDLAIARLAKLREVEYEQKRKEAASQLSVRTSVLDKLVAAARPPDESKPGSGRALKLEQPEAWPEFVNGAALLSEIADAIRKYVVLSKLTLTRSRFGASIRSRSNHFHARRA